MNEVDCASRKTTDGLLILKSLKAEGFIYSQFSTTMAASFIIPNRKETLVLPFHLEESETVKNMYHQHSPVHIEAFESEHLLPS